MPNILDKDVRGIGHGLMGMTWTDTPTPIDTALEVMKKSIEVAKGHPVTWNGGMFGGIPSFSRSDNVQESFTDHQIRHNSLHLLKAYFTRYPEDVDKVILCIKGGMNLQTFKPDGSYEGLSASVDKCNAILDGVKKIDQFEQARRDPNVSPTEIIENLARLEEEGKIGALSLSEVGEKTIREAAEAAKELGTKISSVEVEFSMASTDILHNGVARACADYNIPIYAYSPIGRGLLSGKIRSKEDARGIAKVSPRLQDENIAENLKLVAEVEKLATKKDCTPAQIAIGWVKHHSNWNGLPAIIPIPGASSVKRVEENLNDSITLSDEDMNHLQDVINKIEIQGGRYPESHSAYNWG
ncbi:Aldo/keto reductase [Wallemia mellicola]|uniref:Aldo/keto reductase n=1 Tax=Wallemia mellicola TaxID=1708541 RepID=A0A4T0U5R9_9BASI|nr:hypothetical protein E3Q24_03911 [Wallemia mellicola]TIB82071.1 Aldo/keto reductase [Wallemia mellicola]TIC17633.1 Aldo/keto reductase [Wallemia mellicola]TIC25178.1 Aldo/keto reductase [Wallemia mellicola]TIC31670.1 Aldo/keto reductase [Wallemia mellicola]